jgi:hypothetical protein
MYGWLSLLIGMNMTHPENSRSAILDANEIEGSQTVSDLQGVTKLTRAAQKLHSFDSKHR